MKNCILLVLTYFCLIIWWSRSWNKLSCNFYNFHVLYHYHHNNNTLESSSYSAKDSWHRRWMGCALLEVLYGLMNSTYTKDLKKSKCFEVLEELHSSKCSSAVSAEVDIPRHSPSLPPVHQSGIRTRLSTKGTTKIVVSIPMSCMIQAYICTSLLWSCLVPNQIP